LQCTAGFCDTTFLKLARDIIFKKCIENNDSDNENLLLNHNICMKDECNTQDDDIENEQGFMEPSSASEDKASLINYYFYLMYVSRVIYDYLCKYYD